MKRTQLRNMLCLLAATFCVTTACGKRKINSAKAERLIKEFLELKLETDGVKVKCPKDIKPEKGAEFECIATTKDGHELIATVTQTDGKGAVTWQITKGMLELTIRGSAEKALSAFMSKSLNVKDVDVNCPEKIEVKEGGTFDCTADIDGVNVKATVEQTDDKGAVTYAFSGGILFSEKLAILIQGALKAKNMEAQVNCGQPIRVSKPGGTFECRATNGKDALAIAVTIKNENGNVDWEPILPAK